MISKDQTMVAILMDFVPNEVPKEISVKHENCGKEGQQIEDHTAHDGEDHPEEEVFKQLSNTMLIKNQECSRLLRTSPSEV